MNGFGNDQNFRVLEPEFHVPYFAMGSVNCTGSEGWYTEETFPWSHTQYDSSMEIASTHFSSGVVIPSNYGPSYNLHWHEQDLEQSPSPSSSRSSQGRAPSSNTSYNEIDNRDTLQEIPSPRVSGFAVRTQSPSPMSPSIAHQVDGDFISWPTMNPRGSMTSITPPISVGAGEPFTCPEGCRKKTFGRLYELNRHITEQHRCPHEDCEDIRFTTTKEKRDHEKQHSECGLGFRCGSCLLNGCTVKTLTRGEKLKKHFRDVHGVSNHFDFRDFQCTQSSCHISKTYGGIFFLSQAELDEHEQKSHKSESADAVTSPKGSTSCLPMTHLTIIGEEQAVGNGAKRPLDVISASDAKRWKAKGADDAASSCRSQAGPHPFPLLMQQTPTYPAEVPEPSSAIFPASTSLHSPCISQKDVVMEDPSPQGTTPKAEEISKMAELHAHSPIEETTSLSVLELQALTKQQRWKSLLTDLASLAISPTFDCKQGMVRLRGLSASHIEKGKKLLEDTVNSLRATANSEDSTGTASYPTRKDSSQQVSALPQPEIMALDPNENADVLCLWHEKLLPSFPTMVQEALIEGTYSVTLVRQKVAEALCPIIRFRSSRNQNEASRKIIRDKVKEVCINNSTSILPVQFTEGTLVRLVGGSPRPTVYDDPPSGQRFPHQRRPWATPGMGASIGPRDCNHVSATLGGYISLDDRPYMLTVDHFMSECRCQNTIHVRSPSISDLTSVRFHLRQKLQELSLKIMQSSGKEVPLDQVEEVLFTPDVDEELEQYKRVKLELDDDEASFNLGRVRWRCGGTQLPLRPSANPLLKGKLHRMDWSLSEITARHRMGKNIHRYGRVANPGLKELENEVSRPEGAGSVCTSFGDVVGGEAVHYVGTTSGFREGTVSPTLVQYRDENGIVSHEWAMLGANCERLRDCDFQGDSGAWIISNDNKLLGLLWGWDNGSLLFTPIQDIFNDIRQKTNSHQIGLPDDPTPRASHGLLCRRSYGKLRDMSPERTIQPAELPSPSYLLPPISIEERRFRRRSSGASSAWSLTSTPTLLSSASSITEELSPQVSTPQELIPLPIRTKPQSLSGWVCINEKLSALELAEDDAPTKLKAQCV